ncbi:MAG TPA: hypothetical protein VF006_27305 [Longimicrobium sp.]
MSTTRFNLPLAIALAAALSASPAMAQGNGKGKSNNDRERVEQRDRRDRDDDDDRWDRDDDRRVEPRFERRSSTRRVPPGWCRGRGNPHNTAANCRYNSRLSEWERYDDRDRRWETRGTYERGTSTRYDSRSGGSYDASHRDFHSSHDRQCRERAAQRPLDLRFQVQVRQECRAIHEEWHRRAGIAHR